MPNSRQTNEGATRRYAIFRLNPLSQVAFASNRLPPCRPPPFPSSIAIIHSFAQCLRGRQGILVQLCGSCINLRCRVRRSRPQRQVGYLQPRRKRTGRIWRLLCLGDIETYYEEGYAQESSQKHWKSGKSGGYTDNNYKFYKKESGTNADGFDIHYSGYTKYVTKSYPYQYVFNGFYDGKTVLDIEDDVAHIKLGGKWRMTTSSEIYDLINNCTWQWVSYKGVNGFKVTSKKAGYTDKWIFLPAAGYRYLTTLINVGSYGDYWSSTFDEDSPGKASNLYFDGGVFKSYYGRCNGLSVRPVSK